METDKFVQSKVIQMPIDELKMAQPFCEVFEIRETDLRQVMDAIRKNGFDTLYPIVVWEGHDNVVVDVTKKLRFNIQLQHRESVAHCRRRS